MSIIEETLRKLQAKQTDNDKPAVEEKISKSIKSRTRPFVMIIIALVVLGLGAYIAVDRYQEKLNEIKENLGYETSYREIEIWPVVENREAPIILEPESRVQSFDEQPDGSSQHSPVVTVQPPHLPVRANQVFDPFDKDFQGNDIHFKKTSGRDEAYQQVEIAPINAHKVEPGSNEIVLENEHKKSGGADSTVLNQVPLTDIVGEPESGPEMEPGLGVDEEEAPETVNQLADNTLSSEPVEELNDSEQLPTSLLLEEYAVKKQHDRARNLITTGSYAEATNILEAVIDRSGGTWETYLLIGTAYLGSGELDYAEVFLDMGIGMEGQNELQIGICRGYVLHFVKKAVHKNLIFPTMERDEYFIR